MKKYFLPIVVASLFMAGCSSAYRTGQTPDDVYYSSNPVVQDEIARTNRSYDDSYQSYFGTDDAYLRMKVRNGGKWNTIDDMDYWYGYNGLCQCNNNWGYYNNFSAFNRPWGYNSFAFGGFYNPYSFYNPWSFNNWYSGSYYPYYGNVVIIGNKYPVSGNSYRPRLSGYNNNVYDRGNTRTRTSSQPTRQYRSVFGNSGNNNSNQVNDRPTRTFDNSGSTRSSNSGSGSSGSSRTSSGSGSSSSGRGGRGG